MFTSKIIVDLKLETAIASYETQLLRRNNDYDELKKVYDEAVNKVRL
jgi:hypothetical protein